MDTNIETSTAVESVKLRTAEEIAELGGVSRYTIYVEMRKKRLRHFRIGRRRLISLEDFKAWLQRHAVPAVGE